MSKGCQNRGCKKLARHPSRFCSFHTVLEAPVVPPCRPRKKSPSLSSNINSLLPYRKQKTVAYCQNYSLSHFDQCCLEAIQSIISDLPSTNCRHTVGVRRLVPLPAPVLEKIMPLLLSVVALATNVVAVPLKDPVVHVPKRSSWLHHHLVAPTLGPRARFTATSTALKPRVFIPFCCSWMRSHLRMARLLFGGIRNTSVPSTPDIRKEH